MIEEAKKRSCKILTTTLTKNPFNIAYKIARNQIKSKLTLRSIKQENGEMTTTPQETIEYILDKLYPDKRLIGIERTGDTTERNCNN